MIEIDVKKRIKTYDGGDQLTIKTSFQSNAITALHGPSGVGKTTFLRVLAGLITPEEGMIRVNGQVWLDTKNNINLTPQQRRVGFVFQDYALFPTMTVEKHLQYVCDDEPYIKHLLEIGKMLPFLKHKPGQLSGGQQQRLAILRALSMKPSILLMDEPFSALDNALKTDLLSELKSLVSTQKMTCLIVTHYPFETNGFADHFYEFK